MVREGECLIRLYDVWAGLRVSSARITVPLAWNKVFLGAAWVWSNLFGWFNIYLQQSGCGNTHSRIHAPYSLIKHSTFSIIVHWQGLMILKRLVDLCTAFVVVELGLLWLGFVALTTGPKRESKCGHPSRKQTQHVNYELSPYWHLISLKHCYRFFIPNFNLLNSKFLHFTQAMDWIHTSFPSSMG